MIHKLARSKHWMNSLIGCFVVAMSLQLAPAVAGDENHSHIYAWPLQRLMTIYLLPQLRVPPHFNHPQCGIDETLVREAFMYPASAARFHIVKQIDERTLEQQGFPAGNFIIKITTLQENATQCFSTVDASVVTFQSVKLEFSGLEEFGNIELWTLGSDGWIVRSSILDHPHYISEAVETIARKFITEWNEDNRTPDQH
jgi:hypothetical protein